jgi:hypothetical protein
MSDYVPTTSTVRAGWSDGHPFYATTGSYERYAEFDRWLAAHDREVAAKALRDAAAIDFEWEVFVADDGINSIRQHGKTPSELLIERADRIEATS